MGGACSGVLASLLGLYGTRAKKRHKKKHHHKDKRKKKCGKAGAKPVKGKCCKAAVPVDGACRRCDVCANGCAFASVQAAIDAASPGATIAVCPGTYRNQSLIIEKDLTLVGAGDGAGSGNTILLGSGDASVVKTSAGYIVLQHLRITGGGGISDGAGMYNDGATLEVIGCTVSENFGNSSAPDFFGGGIFSSGTLRLTRCAVRENRARFGGGIFNSNGTVILTDSEIRDNTASAYGGGIFNFDGVVKLDAASRVTGNTADADGGGIFNDEDGTGTLASSANVAGNTPNNCAGIAVDKCSG